MFIANDSVPALAKVVAQRDAPQTDLIWTTDQTHSQGQAEGILVPLDVSRIPNMQQCYDFAVMPDKVGVLWGVGGCAMGYNTELLARNHLAPPQSWMDLFAPALKGHVAWLDFSTAQGITSFLMINKLAGGSEENVDPGFKFLSGHLSQFAAVVSSPAQVDDALQQRQAWCATNLDARFQLLKSRNFPLEVVYGSEGIPQIAVILDLVKGAPHPNLAHAFIDYALSKEAQEVVGNDMLLGPVNRTALLTPQTQQAVIYGPERVQKLVRFDYAKIASSLDDWIGRWNRDIAH
ncbi:MAG: extracellular solute-binding protein [Acetobacteraceae bacterium]